MTETELAYIAGIIDGEGSICLTIRRYPGGGTVSLIACVGMTDPRVPKLLHEKFGGALFLRKPTSIKWKPAWAWSLTGDKALSFIEVIYPYLIIKREQADIAIAFQGIRKPHHRRTDVEKQADEVARVAMKKLNARGPIAQ